MEGAPGMVRAVVVISFWWCEGLVMYVRLEVYVR
jgi:hypothetical protein